MRTVWRTAIAACGMLTLAFLASCGGGGGGGGATPAVTPTVTKGVVEKFGSITVNGVEFRTVGARLHLPDDKNKPEVELQNELEVQNHLKVGMAVNVKGVIDDNGINGAATEIEFRDNLEGVVDDKGIDFITVMGQRILVDDKGKLAGIALGNRVEISGIPDDKGVLHASHLELKNVNDDFEVKGFVSGLTGSGFTLLLAPTATSGIGVTLGAGVALPAGLKNGDFVEVKSAASGASIVATRVELEDEQIKVAENEKLEIEGFISALDLASDRFTLSSGQVIALNAATRFVGGAKADLALGMKVEAEGPIVGGILMATKVAFKDNIRINANATAVDTTAMTITILGLTVAYTSGTEFKDSGSTVDPATLSGKNIEVRGRLSGTGIVATRVDLKSINPATDAFIRGPVSAKTPNSSLTIAGLAINTTAAQFKGISDNPLTGDAFFAAITLNTTVVKARWNPFTGDPAAPVKEVELEN